VGAAGGVAGSAAVNSEPAFAATAVLMQAFSIDFLRINA